MNIFQAMWEVFWWDGKGAKKPPKDVYEEVLTRLEHSERLCQRLQEQLNEATMLVAKYQWDYLKGPVVVTSNMGYPEVVKCEFAFVDDDGSLICKNGRDICALFKPEAFLRVSSTDLPAEGPEGAGAGVR